MDITSEDLAGIYKEVAETIGIDYAYEIYLQFKGMQIMFPLKFYSNKYIAQRVFNEYERGINIHDLVRKYELSESRIRQILRKYKCKDENMIQK